MNSNIIQKSPQFNVEVLKPNTPLAIESLFYGNVFNENTKDFTTICLVLECTKLELIVVYVEEVPENTYTEKALIEVDAVSKYNITILPVEKEDEDIGF